MSIFYDFFTPEMDSTSKNLSKPEVSGEADMNYYKLLIEIVVYNK